MSGRPAISAPDIAGNEFYDDPGKDWDTFPTKIAPPDSFAENGNLPGKRKAAEWDNYVGHHTRLHAIYQDALEVQNFSDPFDLQTSTLSVDPQAIFWSEGNQRLFHGTESKVYRSKQGKVWTADTMPGSPGDCHFFVGFGTKLVTAGTNSKIMTLVSGGTTWINLTVSATDHYRHGAYWNGGTPYFVLGARKASDATAPKIVSIELDGTTTHVFDPGSVSGYTDGGVTHVATNYVEGEAGPNAPKMLAVLGNAPGVSGPQTYYSTDGTTWTSNRIAAIGNNEIVVCIYDHARDLFVMIDRIGRIWQSEDAITWAQPSVVVTQDIDLNKLRSLASYGGIWLMIRTTNRLSWSINMGTNWNDVVFPFEGGYQSGDGVTELRQVHRVDDRFVVLGEPTADLDHHQAVYSLRVKGV